MCEWNMKMVHYHEQKKAFHMEMERAKYFEKLMREGVQVSERLNDGAT